MSPDSSTVEGTPEVKTPSAGTSPLTVAVSSLTATVGLLVGTLREAEQIKSLGILPQLIGLIAVFAIVYLAFTQAQKSPKLMTFLAWGFAAVPVLALTSFWTDHPIAWATLITRFDKTPQGPRKTETPITDLSWQTNGLQNAMNFITYVQQPEWKAHFYKPTPAPLNQEAVVLFSRSVENYIGDLHKLEKDLQPNSPEKKRVYIDFPNPSLVPALYSFLGYAYYWRGVIRMDNGRASDALAVQDFELSLDCFQKLKSYNSALMQGKQILDLHYSDQKMDEAKRIMQNQNVADNGDSMDGNWGIAACEARKEKANPTIRKDAARDAFGALVLSAGSYQKPPQEWSIGYYDPSLAEIWQIWSKGR